MYYQIYEWNHAFLSPARALNDAVRLYYKNPLNPLAHTEFGRQMAAAGDLFERVTRRYGKPEYGIEEVMVDGHPVSVTERIVWERPFCRLVHFDKARPANAPKQPRVVIVAPMSGHYATLLRGTVAAMLPDHDVYITDWIDARMVPLAMGDFDLDDYIDYIVDIIDAAEGDLHLIAVCQPAVPVFAATALLERRRGATLPKSITLMGGPIDTRHNPTEVNLYAAKYDLDWFRRNVIMTVPFPHPGFMRKVYPGFLQLTGFMTMNLDRHVTAHYDYFDDLVKGDGDSADKHREFYDEYMSVMDLTAEFYLQTVDTVFLRQALPNGTMTHREEPVDPSAITRTPIFTVEGEKDDISGLGQTKAAHALTPNLPAEKHQHYEQAGVGHYGVFNGSRFRNEIAPRIAAFVSRWDDPSRVGAAPSNGFGGLEDAAEAGAATLAQAIAQSAELSKTAAEAIDSAAAAVTTASEELAEAARQSAAEAPDDADALAETVSEQPAAEPAENAAAEIIDDNAALAEMASEDFTEAAQDPADEAIDDAAAATAAASEEFAEAAEDAADEETAAEDIVQDNKRPAA